MPASDNGVPPREYTQPCLTTIVESASSSASTGSRVTKSLAAVVLDPMSIQAAARNHGTAWNAVNTAALQAGYEHLISDPTRLDGATTIGGRMVDVTGKPCTVRHAGAEALVSWSSEVISALRNGSVPKGDVLAAARVSGIAATKKVPDLLPLTHVIGVHAASVDLEITDEGVRISSTVGTADRTGVDMEALTAVTIAALAIVDMVKGIDRSTEIRCARIVAKSGGRRGDWKR